MIAKIIEFSVRNRWMVIVVWVGVAIWGVYAVLHTPVDAIPDLSENQVIVFADWMGRSPQDIEEQITYPLSVQLQGLAGVKVIRSSSEFNFSMITIIFDEKTDFYFARTRVLEKLATAQAAMPQGVTPYLAPDATALGQIFWYTVEGEGRSLDELRAIQDWTIRYQLNSIPGVAEVASVGGMVREYQVDVNPAKLRVFDLPLGQLYSAIAASNMSVGGKVVVAGNSEYLVRGVGWLQGIKDLQSVVVASRNGVPVRLGDVATVQLGPEFRRSALEKDGREAVGGVVMMRYGQNPLEVTAAVKDKIRQLQSGLPDGVRIVPFYDRTRLIESAIHTVTGTLREEIIIASIAILLILTHLRSAFVVCVTLPLAALISFLFMYYLNIPSNIMSLSGIAISIGILVDAAVVMVENATHELHQHFASQKVHGDTTEIIVKACRLVGRPIFFSVLIMLLSFLPVFCFGGQEGKLAHPLAYTKSFAMVGVAVLAITLVPALIPLFIRGRLRGEEENWIVRSFINIYKPLLSWIIDRPGLVWWLMGVILSLGAGFVASPVVSALALGGGLIFVLLGVRQTGWTMWIIVAALAGTFLAIGWKSGGAGGLPPLPSLPQQVRTALPWLAWVLAAALVVLSMSLRHWRTAAVATLLIIAFLADSRLGKLGWEFMPDLNEGSIMDMPTTAPRIAMAQALDDVMVRDRLIRSMPEVEEAVGKVGRADTATDPSPLDMVETIITLHPQPWWPKRKLLFDDALKQGAVVAVAMQKRGWLAGATIPVEDWAQVPLAVQDSEYLKFHPKLTQPAELLNTAASAAMEKFDRAMAELARRRQVEYEPVVAGDLTRTALDAVLQNVRSLAPRDGQPALLRSCGSGEYEQILKSAEPHGVLLAQVMRQEELDQLLSQLRAQLIARQIAADRDDLLLAPRSPLVDAGNFLKTALGGHAPGFAEALLETLEQRRDQLWTQRTQELNWELFDQALAMVNSLLLDNLVRSAAGTALAGVRPENGAAGAVLAELKPPLAKRLLLWQKTKDDVLKEMDGQLQMPGWGNAWTQPIINRVNMLATGVRTQIGVKVFGPTGKPLDEAIADVQRVSNQIAARLKTVRGAVDVVPDQAVGKRYLEIHIDRERAARYGVNMAEISEAVETAMGGGKITQTVEGRQRFPVRLRYARDYWQDAQSLGEVLVTTRMTPAQLLPLGSAPANPDNSPPVGAPGGRRAMGGGGTGAIAGAGGGATAMGGQGAGGSRQGSAVESPMPAGSTVQIPLRLVADIRVTEGPSMIKSENGRLRNYVTLNVRDRDIVGFVEEARQAIKPIEAGLSGTGMSIEWSGEFEHTVHMLQTLVVIGPMVIALILFLLYVTFHEALDTLLVFLAVIGALCGALMFQALFGFNFSVIVAIGYVAAFGMATQTGVIMLVYLREALDRHGGLGQIASLEDLRHHVIQGAVHRLRPKLLTEGVAIVGLVPMLWASGTGAEIMRPMAAPVLGGLLISDEVIDIMIPVMFYWIRRARWKKLHAEAEVPPRKSPVPDRAVASV